MAMAGQLNEAARKLMNEASPALRRIWGCRPEIFS
jgi:hypothetical protein